MSGRTGVVLAAGFGSRLADRGTGIKPLTRVAGEPLLFRAFASLQRAGCDDIVVVLGFRSEDLVATIEREYKGGCTIRTVINERYDLANGVSLLAARAAVSHPFIVTMADHVLGDEIMDLAGEHTPVPGGATLLVDSRIDQVFDLDDATKVERDGTRLVAIGKQLTCYNCIDIGVFVCTDGLFEALNAVYERAGNASLSEGVAELARRGLMHTLDIGDGFWQDVDTPQMLAHAAQMLTARH